MNFTMMNLIMIMINFSKLCLKTWRTLRSLRPNAYRYLVSLIIQPRRHHHCDNYYCYCCYCCCCCCFCNDYYYINKNLNVYKKKASMANLLRRLWIAKSCTERKAHL